MKEKKFNIFLQKLVSAYKQFCIWRALQKEEYNRSFAQHPAFWSVVLDTLYLAFPAELAKLTERSDSRYPETISIYSLLTEFKLSSHEATIRKMKKLRDKILMHNDLKTLLDIKKFMNELSLTYGDIENLFSVLIELLDELKIHFQPRNITHYKVSYFPEIQKLCEVDVNRLIEVLSS